MSRTNEVIQYVISEIYNVIESADWLSEKDKQIALIEVDRLLSDLGVTLTQIVPVVIADAYLTSVKEARAALIKEGIQIKASKDEVINSIFKPVVSAEIKQTVNDDMVQDIKASALKHNQALEEIVNDSMLDLSAAIRTARQSATQIITSTLDDVQKEIAQGLLVGDNRRQITQRVMQSFQEDGLTSFITIDNKKLPLDFYSETVVVTKTQTARNHAHLNMFNDYGVKLAYVTGNEPTCGVCARYRGYVYSIDGTDPRFPHIDLYKLFPLHPYCKCRIAPYVEEYKSDEEIQAYIDKAKDFDPETDPRSKKRREAYEHDQKKKRIARQEMKTYAYIKSLLGNEAPKNIGVYRRMKRSNSKSYQELLDKLKVAKQELKVANN